MQKKEKIFFGSEYIVKKFYNYRNFHCKNVKKS